MSVLDNYTDIVNASITQYSSSLSAFSLSIGVRNQLSSILLSTFTLNCSSANASNNDGVLDRARTELLHVNAQNIMCVWNDSPTTGHSKTLKIVRPCAKYTVLEFFSLLSLYRGYVLRTQSSACFFLSKNSAPPSPAENTYFFL